MGSLSITSTTTKVSHYWGPATPMSGFFGGTPALDYRSSCIFWNSSDCSARSDSRTSENGRGFSTPYPWA